MSISIPTLASRQLLALGLAFTILSGGCGGPDPNVDTPTSGRLIAFVDETYAPLIKTLADSFMTKMQASKIEVRTGPARTMVQAFLDAQFIDSTSRDKGAAFTLIIGRPLLPDEAKALKQIEIGGVSLKEYPIAWDGLALAAPIGTPIRYTFVGSIRKALAHKGVSWTTLDSLAPATPLQWLVTDQNSSTLPVLKGLFLADSDITAPARYFATSDSVVAAVAKGEGIGLVSWYAAHRDSTRVTTLAVGRIDSLGFLRNPTRVHPTTLVTDAYPLKQPLIGFTFSTERSLAVGFLAWLTRSEDAQYFIARTGGLQPSVKMRLVLPE